MTRRQAVGVRARFLKGGGPTREHVLNYNRLLQVMPCLLPPP